MKTQPWDPGRYYCLVDEFPSTPRLKHAKGCRDPKRLTLRRDPQKWRFFFSVECSKLLPEEVQARLIRCIPTEGVSVPPDGGGT